MSKHKLKQFLFDINSNKNKGKPEKGNSEEYSVVVLLSGYPYAFYDKTQDTYEGFAVDIMRKLLKDLKLKTKIKWVREKDVNFNQTIEDVAAGKYDLAIGNFSMSAVRAKKISFTHPVYLTDSSLVYRQSESHPFTLIKNILKIWVKPFSIIFILAAIIGLVSYYAKGRYATKKNKLRWHLWGTLAALLGEPGTVIDESDVSNYYSLFLGLIILSSAFYIGSYLTAITTNTALRHTADYDPFDPNDSQGLKNKKILVNKGTTYIDEVKKYGGIPILKERKQDGIEMITDNKKIDGYLNDTGYVIKEKEDRPDFQISFSKWPETKTGIGTTAFVINKHKTELLRMFNRHILKLHKNQFIEVQCSNWMDARPNKKLCRL